MVNRTPVNSFNYSCLFGKLGAVLCYRDMPAVRTAKARGGRAGQTGGWEGGGGLVVPINVLLRVLVWQRGQQPEITSSTVANPATVFRGCWHGTGQYKAASRLQDQIIEIYNPPNLPGYRNFFKQGNSTFRKKQKEMHGLCWATALYSVTIEHAPTIYTTHKKLRILNIRNVLCSLCAMRAHSIHQLHKKLRIFNILNYFCVVYLMSPPIPFHEVRLLTSTKVHMELNYIEMSQSAQQIPNRINAYIRLGPDSRISLAQEQISTNTKVQLHCISMHQDCKSRGIWPGWGACVVIWCTIQNNACIQKQ